MRSSLICALFLVPTTLLPVVASSAHADTYQYDQFASDREYIQGITDSGLVVTYNPGYGCAFDPTQNSYCYETYDHGVLVGQSETLPQLAYDNGTPCAPPTGGGAVYAYASVCNNGRIAFEGAYEPNGPATDPVVFGLWSGPASGSWTAADFVVDRLSYYGNVEHLDLDSKGDLAFANGSIDSDYVAYDLSTVPEPSTFVLLGTGTLALAGAMRRRLG